MPRSPSSRRPLALAAALGLLLATPPAALAASHEGDRAAAGPPCDADDGGLELPEGFCAALVAEDAGAVRHLAVAPNGDLFAARKEGGAGVLALRDRDGDARPDERAEFGPGGAHGIRLTGSHLWLAPDDRVVRWPWEAGQLEPEGEPETVVAGFPEQGAHARKELALGPDGALYVNVGAPSNACQEESRSEGSPGVDPCPQRELHAGIWRYSQAETGQPHAAGKRFATGLRHTLGLAVHPETGALFGVVNGRDQLRSLWGFSAEKNAKLPAEEMVRLEEGDDYGWPYCYYDGLEGVKVLAPEYGGDGTEVGRCADAKDPALAFPAHWAPMAMEFYTHEAFGPEYRGGAFVAFRGSWNRAPLPQEGYRVAFVPFEGGAPAGGYSTFAIGAESDTRFRFTGLAVAPDGSLYASADTNGRIWRIFREEPGAHAMPAASSAE